MLCIKLAEMSHEEAQDALEYAKCGLKHKEDNPSLADVFMSISAQELNHMKMLYDEGLKLVEKHP